MNIIHTKGPFPLMCCGNMELNVIQCPLPLYGISGMLLCQFIMNGTKCTLPAYLDIHTFQHSTTHRCEPAVTCDVVHGTESQSASLSVGSNPS